MFLNTSVFSYLSGNVCLQKGSSSRMPHVDGGEKWILLIKEASQIAHQLPQECRDVRADCCRLQTWMTDEMKKVHRWSLSGLVVERGMKRKSTFAWFLLTSLNVTECMYSFIISGAYLSVY